MATTKLKTIIVTGANRGIGLAICQTLLSHSSTTNQPIKLFAASRAGKPLDLSPDAGSGSEVHYPSLDIADSSSITSLASSFTSNGEGGVDVLINNAGINLDDQYSPENARKTLEINYHGTMKMCHTFLPLLKSRTTRENPSRIVNLSSLASRLEIYSPEIQARFRSASKFPDVEALISDFYTAADNSTETKSGFSSPGRAYNFSKACLNAATFILARENPEVLINSCCPGWVRTDMGRLIGRPPKTVEEGARIPVRLAVGDIEGVTGRYWANDTPRSRESGKVQDW